MKDIDLTVIPEGLFTAMEEIGEPLSEFQKAEALGYLGFMQAVIDRIGLRTTVTICTGRLKHKQ